MYKEGKLWRAEEGEEYWYISEYSAIDTSREGGDSVKWCGGLHKIGNYYRTKLDALAVLGFIKYKTYFESKYGYIDWTDCDNLQLSDEDKKRYDEVHYDYKEAQKNRFTITD